MTVHGPSLPQPNTGTFEAIQWIIKHNKNNWA